MPEDYNEDDYTGEESSSEEEFVEIPMEAEEKKKRDAIVNLIEFQLGTIQWLSTMEDGFYDKFLEDRIKAAGVCFKVIQAAQDRLLDKIGEM